MRASDRSVTALAVLTIVLVAACNSNGSPTAPAEPQPLPHYRGTLELQEHDLQFSHPVLGCVAARIRAAAGISSVFHIEIKDEPSDDWATGFWGPALFSHNQVHCPMNYRSITTDFEILALGACDEWFDEAMFRGCAGTAEVRVSAVLLGLPPVRARAIQGPAVLKLNVQVLGGSDPGSHIEVDLQVELTRL